MSNVSVVIPLYNKGPHIRRAMDSALAQTFEDFEVIVVDDGSTDDGASIVRSYADPRIRLVCQENAGVSAARNRGITEAKSERIAFLDADDEWRPHFLETVLDLQRRYPEAGAYYTAWEQCENGQISRAAFMDCCKLMKEGLYDDYFNRVASCDIMRMWTSALMVPRNVFDVVGNFPVGVRRGQDQHLWTRIALYYRIAWSPRFSAIYHRDLDNRAYAVCPVHLDVPDAEPIEAFLASDHEAPSPRENIREYLAHSRLICASVLCLLGRKAEASVLLRKAAGTKRYVKHRRLVQMALLLPLPLIRLLQRIRGMAQPGPSEIID